MYSKDKFVNILKSYKRPEGQSARKSMDMDSLKELAKMLGVHINTLHNWVNGNTIPNIEVAEYVLYKLGYDLIIVDKRGNK